MLDFSSSSRMGLILLYVGIIIFQTCMKIESSLHAVSYTHLRAHETSLHLVCRLLLEKKINHWRNILISASEQSGRTKIPDLISPIQLETECLKRYKSDLSIFYDTTGKDSYDANNPKDITAVIGPEGGFTEDEKQMAIDAGYMVMQSGPRLLRTETAPIMALSILQYLYGDLSN